MDGDENMRRDALLNRYYAMKDNRDEQIHPALD